MDGISQTSTLAQNRNLSTDEPEPPDVSLWLRQVEVRAVLDAPVWNAPRNPAMDSSRVGGLGL
jgi:hypothetical protein